MVMYLGAEKAGIRLEDYRDEIFRVGENMFNDDNFAPPKGKTDELFSVLFHRRFARPELAFSETTAFPADRLSAKNMAAKLAIPLIADVRNIMMMSGLRPFPTAHWQTLGPAIAKHQEIQSVIAGHRLSGPLKHYWGDASRFVGDDKPYSLFLASGIPFEVTESPADNGWTFLGNYDARDANQAAISSPGTVFVSRSSGLAIDETLPALFRWKRKVAQSLQDVPFVIDDKPAVCAWYPTAQAVVLWNLSESRETLTIRYGRSLITITLEPLAFDLIRINSASS
jgi:hypothetical protein